MLKRNIKKKYFYDCDLNSNFKLSKDVCTVYDKHFECIKCPFSPLNQKVRVNLCVPH